MVREGKPKGFFYLDHRTVDGRHAIVTDTYATPATVHDLGALPGRWTGSGERFSASPSARWASMLDMQPRRWPKDSKSATSMR